MRYLITSALPYVNNVPHLGNLIGCVLSADVFARFCRSKNYTTLYVCGTDEYGTATEAKALEEGVSPKEICDKYHAIHKSIYQWFGISCDYFGRTSTPKHAELTQSIFHSLYKNGHMLEQEVEQPYDEKLKMFLADRFVIGTCPHCSSEHARSDQCDKCGRLLTFAELIHPKSKLTGTSPILKRTRHLFLDLAAAQPKLEDWINKVEKEGHWSQNTLAIARSWLKEGLKPRSITRDLTWGVPVPLPGWEKKVFYVWFDAPIGYISITANHTQDYMSWWGGDDDVRHYEFMGKDNVPFHSIIFPATLLGTNQNWTLPYQISTTEFLNYEDGKFSKSRGVGVFGDGAMDSGLPADVWRYYLLANRPETSDTTFSWDDFGHKSNSELLANYGNLVNRVLVFLAMHMNGKVPGAPGASVQPPALSEDDLKFWAAQNVKFARVGDLLEQVRIKEALHEFMSAAKAANGYLQEQQPWKTAKENPARAAATLYVLTHQIKDLAIAGEPFLPFTSSAIWNQLRLPARKWDDLGARTILSGHTIGTPEHLFKPIDKKKLDELRTRFAGKQEKKKTEEGKPKPNTQSSASKSPAPATSKPPAAPVVPLALENLQLEVGLIESVERHPNAEKLYVEKILMSNGELRQICSGLVPYMPPEELQGRACIVVKNLKPVKLRGMDSEGMLLAAEKDGVLEVVTPAAPAGTPVEIEGVKSSPSPSLISIDEFRTILLEAKGGLVYANGKRLLIDAKPISLSKVKDGRVS